MVKPYTLKQAQELVSEAVVRSDKRHKRWRVLEVLYRTGSVRRARQAAAADTATIDFGELLGEEVVNLIKPHTDVIIASVVAHDPTHMCVPYGGGEEAELNAKVSEAAIRYFWLRTRATSDVKDATWDMVVTGNGFLKVGWNHAEEDRDLGPEEIQAQFDELWEAAQAEAELAGDAGIDEDALVDLLQQSVTEITLDEPFIEYVSPYDVFVPANARRMNETRWVCQRVTLPLDELKDNPAFDSSVDLLSDGAAGVVHDEYVAEWRRQAEDSQGQYGSTDVFETGTVWEFYDMRARRLTVFQLGADKPLYDDDLPYDHRYPPFVHMRNYGQGGTEFWAFGDVENVANIQSMLNEFVTEQIGNARRSGQKYLVDRQSMTPELQTALESDQPDVVAVIENPQKLPLTEVIIPVARQALSGDVYAAKADLEDWMSKVLGINDFQAGGVGADRMSATAAAVVDGIASLRAQEKVAQVEDAVAHAGNLLLLLCQQFLEEPTAIRVSGVGGAAWPQVDREVIKGEFLVSVAGGSMKAINPATREQKAMRLLNEIAPALGGLGFDPIPAVRSALRDMGYDPDILMQPLPQPELPPEGDPLAGGEQLPTDAPASVAVDAGGPPTAVAAQAEGGLAL